MHTPYSPSRSCRSKWSPNTPSVSHSSVMYSRSHAITDEVCEKASSYFDMTEINRSMMYKTDYFSF